MALHLDHRPKSLDEFYGNAALKASLASVLERKEPRAFMFTGQSGCGKTTLARIVAQAYGCDMATDYHELNIAQIGGKDESGRIQREMHYAPMGEGGKVRCYCLDECQDASPAFQAGILKALEDTPAHVLFILCTTDPQRLKKTIHTRCSRFEVQPLDDAEMVRLLAGALAKEGMEGYPKEPLLEIARASEGSPRQALVMLNQVIDLPTLEEVMAGIRRFAVDEASLIDLCRALVRGDSARVLSELRNMDDKAEVEKARHMVLSYARKAMVGKDGWNHRAALVVDAFREPFYNSGLAGFILACWRGLGNKGL